MMCITIILITLIFITGDKVFGGNDHKYDHCYSSKSVSQYPPHTIIEENNYENELGRCFKFHSIKNSKTNNNFTLLDAEILSQCFTFEIYKSIQHNNFNLNLINCLICFKSSVKLNKSIEYVFETTDGCQDFSHHVIKFIHEISDYRQLIEIYELKYKDAFFRFVRTIPRVTSDLNIYFNTLNKANYRIMFIDQNEIHFEYSNNVYLILFICTSCFILIPLIFLIYQYLRQSVNSWYI